MGVLGIAGSLREISWNRRLLKLALGVVRQMGEEAEEFDLLPLPMYNAELEVGGYLPVVTALRDSILRSDAIIMAAPEFNGTIPAVIKNVVEWGSRPPNVFPGKLFFVMGATPGSSGSMRMAMHLTHSLESEGAWVMPQPRVLLPQVDRVIGPDGSLLDPALGELLEQAMARLLETAGKLKAQG